METVRGESDLLLTCREAEDGVCVAQVRSAGGAVILPAELLGRPVTELGPHAFSPDRPETAGIAVRVSCAGGVLRQADNRALTDVTLPRTLRRVGDYAFYNCTGLHTLRLWENGIRWGGAALMNCAELYNLFLRRTGADFGTLRYFADELTRELDVTVTDDQGGELRLIFPEYLENYEENAPAHHFDYVLTGAGYPYHHCFRGDSFSPLDFDGLWETFLRTEHDDGAALRLSWWRLRRPLGLERPAAARYLAYLAAHADAVLAWLLERRDGAGLKWFLTAARPDRAALTHACAYARDGGAADAQALVLEELHRRFPARREKSFDL